MELDKEKLEIIKDFVYQKHGYMLDTKDNENHKSFSFYYQYSKYLKEEGYSEDEIKNKIIEIKSKSKSSRKLFNEELYKTIKMYEEQEENASESIIYKFHLEEIEDDYWDWPFAKCFKDLNEYYEALSNRIKEINKYGLKNLITKVEAEQFFSHKLVKSKKDDLAVEELEDIPRFLRFRLNYVNTEVNIHLDNLIHVVADKDYKDLFMFSALYMYNEDLIRYYKYCSILYPNKVPKISEDIFNELLEIAKEKDK